MRPFCAALSLRKRSVTGVRRRQLKHVTRAACPDEYDAAVARDPTTSINAALGDRRTGRQLLADAAADRQSPLSVLAACPGGRAELDTIAVAVEALNRSPGLPCRPGRPGPGQTKVFTGSEAPGPL